MQEEFVTLKWGDIIRIHGVNISKKKNTKGLIISKGFTDTNVYYQIYNQFSEVNFYRESLFQILPRVNFDMHDQLLDETISQESKQSIRSRAQGQINALQSAIASKAGKQIKYGSEVIFRHIQSKSYIFGLMKAANSGQGAFKIEISESLSSNVIFKLVSPRTFQNQNDKIYYNDALQIYHPSSDSFMNFSQVEQPIYLDLPDQIQQIPEDHQFKKFSQKRPFIKKPNNKRTFIMNQNKAKNFWKFIQHCSYQQFNDKEKIKSHDIVYFKHTKKNQQSLVSTSISQPLQSYLKQNEEGNLSYECFWELIPKQVNQFGPEDCNIFCARNIVTGQLLKFNDFSVEIAATIKSEGKGFDNKGLIHLICSFNQDINKAEKLQRLMEILQDESLPKIEGFYEAKSKKFRFQAVESLPKDIFMIYKVDEELLLDAMFVISSHQSLIKFVEKLSSKLIELSRTQENKQNYPKLFEIFQQDQLADIVKIQKLLAGKIYGTDYENIVSSGNTPNQNVQRILVQTGIVQILIQILHHLYEPFKFIQSHTEPSEDRAIRVKITEIFEYTYKLLEKTAANFEQNRIYISRWMDIFLEHSNNISKSYIQQCLVGILHNNPDAIEATIDESKINNIIENFFSETQRDIKGPITTKYLRLFSTFIVCEDSVIKQNQNIILKNFFKNPKNHLNFKFKVEYKNEGVIQDENDPFKVKSKQVLIAFGNSSYMPIVEFFQTHNNKWNYLMSYINLLADVCKNRNANAIQSVSAILSLQAVSVILFDSEVANINQKIKQTNREAKLKNSQKIYEIENAHQPFIKIAHHAYVDNHKFQEIKRIMRISQWHKENKEDSQTVEDINTTKRVFEGEKQEEQQTYLQSILQYIKNYIKQCNQDPSNLNMLYSVLSLLKSTIILGLWNSIRLFRQLAPQLMLKIAKIQNHYFFEKDGKTNIVSELVDKNKQKLKLNRPEITLGIQCKIQTIQIFKYITDLQIDIRVRYIMNFFKGLYECTQNFNVYDLPYNEQLRGDATQQDVKRNQIAEEQYLRMDGKALFGDQVKKMSEDVDILLKQNIWLNKLKQLTPFQFVRQDDPMKDRYLFQGYIDPDKENYQEQLKQQFSTMVLGLFELSVYEDYNLLNSSLNMLRIMFQQRKDLLNNFKKILICGKGNLQEVYLTLKFMRQKFNMLANKNILQYEGDADKSFPYAIKKSYDYLIKDREKRSGIVEDLFFLSRTLKDGTSLRNIESLMSVDDEIFKPDQVYNFINEKQKNNLIFQQLNLAEGIYKPLFEYIKIIGNQNFLQPNQRKLLLSIYQYLTLLCFNNLEAKQILMSYIEFTLPHLKNKVGAASFLYQVTRNNKLLISNQQLVTLIINKALENCVELEQAYAISNFLSASAIVQNNDFQKSRILYALKGILLYNDQGHKRNQQLLMNSLQNNKFNKLIFQEMINYKANLNDFNLSSHQTYVAYHFELFSALVESGNMINIGKLQNLHSYQYCLENLSNTNRWQIRRSLRAYINRLYYVNKDKDIFLFEKFISRQFTILNTQLGDLVELHRKKLISQDLKLKNGIRFSYAQSLIFLQIIQCLITIHEMFLKPKFLVILRRQIEKQSKTINSFKSLHENLIRLFKNLGCIKRIYQKVKFIDSFIKQIYSLLSNELKAMNVRDLEKKAEPEDTNKSMQQTEQLVVQNGNQNQNQNASVDMTVEKKNYTYDHSKSFFRNLCTMIKFLRYKQHIDDLKEKHQQTKKQVNLSEDEMKQKYLEAIFSVPNEKLRPYLPVKNERKPMHYDPHLQTANSRIFKVLAKPQFGENQQNYELNNKLLGVKTMIEDSPALDKFKDDQFIFFVNKTLYLNETSTEQYKQFWQQQRQQPRPVISINEIFTKIFKLIMNNPDKIDDQQKIFVIKLTRCFITEAVQEKQLYKRSVDKWDADYFAEDEKFSSRQEQIEQCGGSDFIISIFKQNLTNRIQLLNEALLLGIAYLYGGNSKCQNSILNSLKKDPQNVMLINIKSLIKNIGDFLINIRKIKQNQKKRNFSYNIVDTYDYFNPQDKMICKYFGQAKVDKYQVQIELDNEKALCRTFRFLQLFCENNNEAMKNFLSSQINENGEKKTNSINFIQETTILLKKIFRIMNNKLVMIPNSILAFIVQITQVPVLCNQISFMKSTFFEDISYMASFFDAPENKEQRKFNYSQGTHSENDPLNSLSQIYRQAVGLALGNFQGNDSVIINQFLNKCQPKFLWLVIRDQLWSLIKTKYSKFDFVVLDEQSDHQSRIKTFKNLTIEAVSNIIHEQKKQKNFEGPICSIIQVLIILRKIEDFIKQKYSSATQDKENPNSQSAHQAAKGRQFKQKLIQIASQQLAQKGQEMQKQKNIIKVQQILGLFDHLILQIQVNCFNGISDKLQNIYFCNHPVFDYLAATTRDQIMNDVSRTNHRDKLTSLLGFSKDVYEQISWNYDMNYYVFKGSLFGFHFEKSIPITSILCEKIRKTTVYCSYLIIALMFYFILAEHEVNEVLTTYFTFANWKERLLLRVICTIQLILMILHLIIWYMLRGQLVFKKYLKNLEEQGQSQAPNQQQDAGQNSGQIGFDKVILSYLTQDQVQVEEGSSIKNLAKKAQILVLNSLKTILKLCLSNPVASSIINSGIVRFYKFIYRSVYLRLLALWSQSQFKAITLFLLTAILGNFSGIQWYTIHLFNLFVGVPSLINVFKAILNNLQLLLILSLLLGSFVFVFNVLSLNTYTPVIYEDELPEDACSSIFSCVLVVYTSGAIGDDMDEFHIDRFLFNIVYLVFMELLFTNLVGGIVIDAYTSLTQDDSVRAQDKKGTCYICQMQKSDIEKQGQTFKKHTDRHYLWNYIYYIYCLKNKDPTDFTGIEYIIQIKLNDENIDWFPAKQQDKEDAAVEGLVQQLKQKIDIMKKSEKKIIEKSEQVLDESTKKLTRLPVNIAKQVVALIPMNQ